MLADKKLSFVGAGQMGEAVFRGFLESGIVEPEQLLLSDVNVDRLESLKDKYGIGITVDNRQAVRSGTIVVLAVKPQQIKDVLRGAQNDFRDDAIVISIAAGVTTGSINDLIQKKIPVIRVMPNTPALVGKAMSIISRGAYAGDDAVDIALQLFSSVGNAIELPEDLQNQATAISGSGPAYFFLMVEALVEAAKRSGIDGESAIRMVVQTMLGSAIMLKETGRMPDELREMVTSPGGTTAAALQVFNKHEFSVIVQEAVEAAIKRATELA